MDFNQGRFPLEFISFYLDMSSEEQLGENPTQHSEDNEVQQFTGFRVSEDTAESNERTAGPVSRQADILTPSTSIEESVSASSGVTETVQETGPSSSNPKCT